MNEMRLKFYNALFDPNDKICFGNGPKTCNKPIEAIPYFLTTDAQQFAIHSFNKWRVTENVKALTTFLFECDDESLVPKQQIKRFIESGLPFTTMTFSGKKSIHVIIRLTQPLKDKDEYERWWRGIEAGLKKWGIKCDDKARLVTQISRLPGSIRTIDINGDTPETSGQIQKEQTSIYIRSRVEHDQIHEWLAKNEVTIPEPKVYKPKEDYIIGSNSHVAEERKFKMAVSATVRQKGDQYCSYAHTGNHDWLLKLGINLYKFDVDIDAAEQLARFEWGLTYMTSADGLKPIENAIRAGYKWAHNRSIEKITLK